MKRLQTSLLKAGAAALSASLLAAPVASAATASSNPLGYTTIQCLWSSDTLCSSAGITEKPDFIGKVLSVAGSVVTVDAAPGWTADEFAETHYARFTSGAKVGRYFTVTANGADSLTLGLAGDDISDVVAEDGIKLVKYWTLGTLFPVDNQSTIIQSAGTIGPLQKTKILFPDLVGEGINLSTPADKIYILVTGTGWVSTQLPFPAADDTRILPDMYFIIRHKAAPAGNTDPGTEFVPMGHVEESPTTVALSTRVNSGLGKLAQDNAVALSRPVAVTLAESDLVSSGAFVPSLSGIGPGRRDELLVFDLDVDTITTGDLGINRSAAARYYYNGATGHWINVTNGGTIADDELVFQPGTGVQIRKYKTDGGTTSFWVFDPNS